MRMNPRRGYQAPPSRSLRFHIVDGHPVDRRFHSFRQFRHRLRFCLYQHFAIGHDMPFQPGSRPCT
ncbi:hypothetical protein BVI1335_1030012 [Burkholderia vietnamiensis]|nr:hypothetical protein BVI1335_1030012 [Burkholderia vietnamiensis]